MPARKKIISAAKRVGATAKRAGKAVGRIYQKAAMRMARAPLTDPSVREVLRRHPELRPIVLRHVSISGKPLDVLGVPLVHLNGSLRLLFSKKPSAKTVDRLLAVPKNDSAVSQLDSEELNVKAAAQLGRRIGIEAPDRSKAVAISTAFLVVQKLRRLGVSDPQIKQLLLEIKE